MDNLVLHKDLIQLIMDYAKAHEVKSSPVLKIYVFFFKSEVQVVSNTDLKGEDSGFSRDWQDQDLFDDPDYCLPIGEGLIHNIILGTSSSRCNKHPRWAASKYKNLGTKPSNFVSPKSKKPKSRKGGANIDSELEI